jgi:hypothetical protein
VRPERGPSPKRQPQAQAPSAAAPAQSRILRVALDDASLKLLHVRSVLDLLLSEQRPSLLIAVGVPGATSIMAAQAGACPSVINKAIALSARLNRR